MGSSLGLKHAREQIRDSQRHISRGIAGYLHLEARHVPLKAEGDSNCDFGRCFETARCT